MKPLFASRKLTFGLIFLIGFFQYGFSQQLKTYQGPYEEGTAIYQYYENENYERIFQGNFKYISDNITVIGNYDKNKRVGKWTIDKILPEGDYLFIHIEGYKEIVAGNYINGDMDGLWTLKRTSEKTKKVIINSQVNFKKGYLINSFKYFDAEYRLNNYETTKLLLTGKFDSNGSFDSTWILTYSVDNIPFENIRKFKDGIIYFHLLRNLSTGEIIEDFKNDNPGSIKFNAYLNENNVFIYSSIFEIWRRIKTPNSYDFENPVIHARSSNEKLLKLFPNQSDITLTEEQSISNKETKDQQNSKEFNTAIAYADSAYNKKKYESAITFYQHALSIKDDSYAISQLEKAKQILNAKEENEKQKVRQKEEQKQEEERKNWEFENSDYNKIKNQIKTNFTTWMNKNEFETEQDNQLRIKDQGISQFQKIVNDAINSSKAQKLRSQNIDLGYYNPEDETFLLIVEAANIHIKINKQLAASIKEYFSSCEENTKIVFVPLDLIMINNNWSYSKAIIVLNLGCKEGALSGFTRALYNGYFEFSIDKKGKVLFKPYRNKDDEYSITNFSKLKDKKDFNQELYYYEWNIAEETRFDNNNSMQIDFKPADFDIVFPIK